MSRPSVTRAFAYNPGSPIGGTEQIGSLAIGITPQNYSLNPGGVTWWEGPNESEAYIIAYPQSNGLHPTQIPGTTASLGFWGDKTKTEAGFLALVQNKLGQQFQNGDDAKNWLNDNGYWTSWGPNFTLSSGDITYFGQRYGGYSNPTSFEFTCDGNRDTYNGIVYTLPGSLATDIANVWTAAGLDVNLSYVWKAHFGNGVNLLTRIALNPDNTTNAIGIVPIDTSNNNWLYGNLGGPTLAGRYEFPASFTLYTPIRSMSSHNDWC